MDQPLRSIRVAVLLRWTAVAIHTAVVVSFWVLQGIAGGARWERAGVGATEAFLACVDPLATIPIVSVHVYVLAPGKAHGLVPVWLTSSLLILLGGLQWYWIGSLVARFTVGLQRRLTLGRGRAVLLMSLGLVFVGLAAGFPWAIYAGHRPRPRPTGPYRLPNVAFSGDSRDLERSVVVPTLDTRLPKAKNAIWCATFQMAWDRLKEDVIGEAVRVANAEEVVERLNQGSVAAEDLPEDGAYATAGAVKDGITERVRAEMQQRFQKEPVALDGDATGILAYAYLRASVPFTLPYFESEAPLVFVDSQGHETRVSSFGLTPKAGSAPVELYDQVDVLYCKQPTTHEPPTEFVLDLCCDSKPNQLLVAQLPPQETLAASLADLEQKIRNPPDRDARLLLSTTPLVVPNLNWRLVHHFSELEGRDKRLLNRGFEAYYLAQSLQTIDFRLDRSGVELESEARVVWASAADWAFRFDHPFLIVVKKRGASRPFFVMWVDNGELLSKPD